MGPAPLVVDLDGTLARTDTLVESVLQVARLRPLELPAALARLGAGRAAFKEYIAERARVDAADLPYNEGLLEYLRAEKRRGRTLVLATAAHCSAANAVAEHLGLFDKVIATGGGRNMKGQAKLAAIEQEVGPRFVYAADSVADLPIWKHAEAAILVGAAPAVAGIVRRSKPVEREFPAEPATPRTWLRALRVHQWLKNLLLFVPILSAFSFFDPAKLGALAAAFAAFSLAASATYIVNDLWDVESDRIHPRKRTRPFASGRISAARGLVVAAACLAVALAIAAAVNRQFFLLLVGYLALTSAYSWILKRKVVIDVLALAVLYTLRILAGAAAAEIVVSAWLLAFSIFVFFSLALVKRCGELVSLQHAGGLSASGRDYNVSDMLVLWPLGVGSTLCAVVVFGLFVVDAEAAGLYASPRLLWIVAIGLIYWLSRLWIKSVRGEMDDDPLVYALRDRNSRITVLGMVTTMVVARFADVG